MDNHLYYKYTNNKPLNEKMARAVLDYVEVHKNSIIKIDNFAFDMNSLNTPILLSKCLDCEKYQEENCCPGSPYSMPDYQKEDLRSILPGVIGFMPEGQVEEKYSSNLDSIFTKGNSVVCHGNREGRCIFSFHQNGVPKCAIHGYCLENNLNPFKYKPFICSLFPLFAVEFPSGLVMFFCHNKETEPLSFYWYTLSRRPCVNLDTLDRVVNNTEFKSKYLQTIRRDSIILDNIRQDFLPAWKEQKSVLKFFVGEEVYNKLENSISG